MITSLECTGCEHIDIDYWMIKYISYMDYLLDYRRTKSQKIYSIIFVIYCFYYIKKIEEKSRKKKSRFLADGQNRVNL